MEFNNVFKTCIGEYTKDQGHGASEENTKSILYVKYCPVIYGCVEYPRKTLVRVDLHIPKHLFATPLSIFYY